MDKYIQTLKNSSVFSDIPEKQIKSMVACMQPALRHYKKGEYVFRHGQPLDFLTVMLEGSVHIQHDDYWGNRSIINVIGAGDMFGESFALSANTKSYPARSVSMPETENAVSGPKEAFCEVLVHNM